MSETLFHIATHQAWAGRGLRYQPADYAEHGFIHCCNAAQLAGVAGRYFRGCRNLLVLEIDPARVDAEIRWENLLGGAERFPHLYGTLDPAAVSACRPAWVDDRGVLRQNPEGSE